MFWTTFSIQIWNHAYATVGSGRLVDRFVTCNVKIYICSGPFFANEFGIMPTLQSAMVD